MSQDIQVILVKNIKSAKSGKKGLANAVLDQLYDSISKEGLLNPISVRPDPEKADTYKIVAGEHRFYVIAKMMKEESIRCIVFTDMSDEEAELAALSENVCRTHAKPADRLLALRKWQDVYQKYFPQLMGNRGAANARWANSTKAEAKQKAIDEEKAKDAAELQACDRHSGGRIDDAEATVEVEVASEPVAKPAETQTFKERVQAATGTPMRTLERDLRIVNNLTEEQVWVLDQVACTKMGMLQIIDATDDVGKRGEIVNLVASGMEVEQAIKEVTGLTAVKDQAGRVKEPGEKKAKKAEKTEEPKLSDEEWFARECGEFSGFLTETDQYKSDAILYHRIAEARTEFRKKIKKIIEEYREERKGKKVGWFYLQLYRIINISHPKDWKICYTCGGKSLVDPGDQCPECKGACYDLKSERY